MRRFLPVLILVVGLAALGVDFLSLSRPFSDPPAVIDTRLGLDLQGGLRGEYRAVGTADHPVTAADMSTIRTIIENRINKYGVAEPLVQTQGSDRITVEIPGVTNVQDVRNLIGSTGRLDFVGVPPARNNDVVDGQPIPPDLPVIFSGDQIESARAGFTQTGQRAVELTLKADGARIFDQYAAAHYQQRFAIVLDGIVHSAPSINATHFGGKAEISGGFSTQVEVNNLVLVLSYGSLPLAIEEVSFSTISPTLGLDFLQQSVLAGAIGIALVFVFMLLHYRLPGVVACVALIYYALVVFALFRLIPVTLTLAGVAAFVLSVAMAVDANILIFERTKEELRAGKTLVSAVEAGLQPRLELDLRLEHVEHHHRRDPLLLWLCGHPRLRPRADPRGRPIDVHGHHAQPPGAALGRPPAVGSARFLFRSERGGVHGRYPARPLARGRRQCLT